jgi:hypothetical protein
VLKSGTPRLLRKSRPKNLSDQLFYLDIDSIVQLHSYCQRQPDATPDRNRRRTLVDLRNADEIDRIVALSG